MVGRNNVRMPLRTEISLNGQWEMQLQPESGWRPITVPVCWEAAGVRKDFAGPVTYRRTFELPVSLAGRRIWPSEAAVISRW